MKATLINTILHRQKVILMAVCILISPIALGVNGFEEHRKCIKETVNKAGQRECMGYYLPYRNKTLSDYRQALSDELTETRKRKLIELANKYYEHIKTDIFLFFTPVDNDSVTGEFYQLSINLFQSVENYPGTVVMEHVYMILALLQVYGAELYPEIKADDMNHIAHDLYAMSQGYYLEKTPDVHFATQNHDLSILIPDSFVYGDQTTKLVHFGADFTKTMIGKLFNFVGAAHCDPFHWSSLESAKNLLRLVPELKDYPVLQIDPGSGALANMLEMEGVDIISARVTYPRNCEETSHFHGYVRTNVVDEINWKEILDKYTPERKLFLLDNDYADRASDLEYLKNTDEGTMVVLIERQSFPIEKFISDFHIKRIPGNKVFKMSVHKYENGDDVDVFVLRRKKSARDEL